MLWETGHFPASTPPTMRAFLVAGQRSVDELVDRYPIRDKAIRQLLIDYISRRRADSDYCHIESMARMLAGHFRSAIEAINPAQAGSLEIDQATYGQWREGLNWLPDGRARKDPHSILILVRALYTDLHSWAVEDPATWARWAVACPIPNGELRGYGKRRRRLKERIDDRMRLRQPLLPALVEYVETRYEHVRSLLAAARSVEPGTRFTHDGREFQRIDRGTDRSRDRYHLRVRDLVTGETTNITLSEDYAFWRCATVEVLRLSGVRSEELCELSHLSIRQYRRPNGEVIALLVIAPSKSDRERVMPMSAELFHVIAQIIKRHTAGADPVPLLTRYDTNDRSWSEPMPFLFQRQYGRLRTVASPGTIQGWLTTACRELAETHPGFRGIRFSPHDFRRLFATELANSGLPIHIGAALLGHLNLETFRGYVTVFDEEVIRHYQAHLNKRRRDRNQDEYSQVSAAEWSDFEEHFDKRKVELGGCARPYGTGCPHEHACIRCPMLNINPKMLPRLTEIETDLLDRRARAEREGWIGEIEGIDLTLSFLKHKREQTERLTRLAPRTGPPHTRTHPCARPQR
ncbi:site-specific integrase [Nocardia kruczakiae]|uniref:site-specific integrase n=1 Tax=Nocardia kruczakiae TaxID=261477 RepID=UPI0007A3CBBA|nr:site-specific integrase [Nocardia kruczakiae]